MNGTLILTENNIDKVINLEDDLEIPIEDYPGEHESCGPDCDINHSHHPHNEEEIINCEKCDTDESDCDIEDCECECHDEEDEDFDLNSQFGKYDFGIILKTDNCDINLIIPESNMHDEEFLQKIDNFSQNAFLLNYVNYALNNNEWIDQYAKTFQNQSTDALNKLIEESGLNDLLNSDLYKQFEKMSDSDLLKSLTEDKDFENPEKYLDFDSLKKMFDNKNKPKIIT